MRLFGRKRKNQVQTVEAHQAQRKLHTPEDRLLSSSPPSSSASFPITSAVSELSPYELAECARRSFSPAAAVPVPPHRSSVRALERQLARNKAHIRGMEDHFSDQHHTHRHRHLPNATRRANKKSSRDDVVATAQNRRRTRRRNANELGSPDGRGEEESAGGLTPLYRQPAEEDTSRVTRSILAMIARMLSWARVITRLLQELNQQGHDRVLLLLLVLLLFFVVYLIYSVILAKALYLFLAAVVGIAAVNGRKMFVVQRQAESHREYMRLLVLGEDHAAAGGMRAERLLLGSAKRKKTRRVGTVMPVPTDRVVELVNC